MGGDAQGTTGWSFLDLGRVTGTAGGVGGQRVVLPVHPVGEAGASARIEAEQRVIPLAFECALDWFVADPVYVDDRLRSLIVCRWERGATCAACSGRCCSALTTSAALAGALLRSSGHRFSPAWLPASTGRIRMARTVSRRGDIPTAAECCQRERWSGQRMTREDNQLTDLRVRDRRAVNVLAEVPKLATKSCMHENEARHDTEVQGENDSQETETQTPGLAIRRSPRRGHERRTDGRTRSDRRRVERRRRRIRTLLLVAATAGIPGAVKGPATFGLFPGVAVSVDQFRAVPADKAYDDLIKEAAQTYALDEDLIRAVIRAESSFDPLQVSPAGAKGLMQIMPVLAKELGVSDPFDPRQNVMAGARLSAAAARQAFRQRGAGAGELQRGTGQRRALQGHAALPRNTQLRQEDQGLPRRRGDG